MIFYLCCVNKQGDISPEILTTKLFLFIFAIHFYGKIIPYTGASTIFSYRFTRLISQEKFSVRGLIMVLERTYLTLKF